MIKSYAHLMEDQRTYKLVRMSVVKDEEEMNMNK
jgi:hypothetical protein